MTCEHRIPLNRECDDCAYHLESIDWGRAGRERSAAVIVWVLLAALFWALVAALAWVVSSRG